MLEISNALAYISKTKERNFCDGISQNINTHIVNMTSVLHHLVKNIDKIKHDLQNCDPLHDIYFDLKVLTNGVQVLKSMIGKHPELLYNTLWPSLSAIYLVFDYTKYTEIENLFSDLN